MPESANYSDVIFLCPICNSEAEIISTEHTSGMCQVTNSVMPGPVMTPVYWIQANNTYQCTVCGHSWDDDEIRKEYFERIGTQ